METNSLVADLNAIAVFAFVVEEKGFTAAARRLGVSKSAISKAIAKLESTLGVRLLNRTTRQLGLTDAGESLYEHAAQLMAVTHAAEAAVGRLREGPVGELRVNAPVAIGRQFVTPIVLELLSAHPQLRVDLTVQDDFVDLIESRTDVAVRIGRLADSRLIARRIASVGAHIVAAPAYLARRGTPSTPDDLTAHDLARYTISSTMERVALQRGGERERVRVTGSISTNSGEVITQCAIAGHCMAILPYFHIAQALDDGALVRVLPDWKVDVELGVYAVVPHARSFTPKVRRFVDALVEAARDAPIFGPAPTGR